MKNKEIEVRGARVNNLQNIDLNLPLGKFIAISGLSGSGKSSLAMGVLYAEGARRYLDALSTYTRRRISQDSKADVTTIRHLPAALALRQRPTVPNKRSTVGTMTESANVCASYFPDWVHMSIRKRSVGLNRRCEWQKGWMSKQLTGSVLCPQQPRILLLIHGVLVPLVRVWAKLNSW